MGTSSENSDMEQHGVRWGNTEIIGHQDDGEPSLETTETLTGKRHATEREDLDPQAIEELKQLKTTFKNNIQSSRMQHHNFEPVSLPGSQPASRVPSGSMTPSRRFMQAGSMPASPRISPPHSTVHSPPLTPAGTKSRDTKPSIAAIPGFRPPSDVMTPQRSASPSRKPSAPTSAPSHEAVSSHPRHAPTFAVGPSGDSLPPSQDVSPTGTPASTAPGTPAQRPIDRPFTPGSEIQEVNSKGSGKIVGSRASSHEAFRFGNRDPSQGYSNSGQANVTLPPNPLPAPKASLSGTNLSALGEKSGSRTSLFGGKKHDDSSSSLGEKHHSHSSSKANLKRFFKFGDHKHKHEKHDKERNQSIGNNSGTQTPPNEQAQSNVPFADDHGLVSKYGKFGKMLGSGAGGSVRLMKRTGDGVTFAVKQFRDRHAYESEKEYNKKVTAEFCIGSTLHHGNIIETIDIIHEKGKWYEVMEYAPYDLFATVMTGKMSRDEVTCCTMQILSGVIYLHSMGLAHRDLKLDNVVINEHGIMKLIDFGSAVVFRYPFENEVVLASGVVGSDPYLAPEVYDHSKYDPRMADIWSIAIIFCCMTLRRFPWKAPRISDNSYRLFVSPPDPDQDQLLDASRRSSAKRESKSEPTSRGPSVGNGEEQKDGASTHNGHHHHHHHHHHKHEDGSKSEQASRVNTSSSAEGGERTIKGPIRLLRLLPRETRRIIGRMLDLDPKRRADIDEILQDPWVQDALVCSQSENGVIHRAPGHTHTLQPSSGGSA